MSKNVLYVGGFELPDKNAAAQRVIANGKLFHSIGYNVIFVGIDKTKYFEKKSLEILNIDDFKFFKISQKYPSTTSEWISFITDISFLKSVVKNDLKNNVDIIIAYNYPSIALYKLMNYAKRKNIKVIADVTEWYVPQGNITYRIIKGLDAFFRMKILHKKTDGLITISKFLSKYYKNHPTVIELPPLIDKRAAKWESFENKPQKNNEKIKLIYAGSPGNGQKDKIDYIIELLSLIKKSIRNFELTVIGISKEKYLEVFGENAIPENIKNQIFFLGVIPHLEAIEYIKKSDFSILIRENNLVNTAGFPTKFVESITCGTPVLANPSSNISQYLIRNNLGILLDDSSQANLLNSLSDALNKSDEEVNFLKDNCKNFDEFDYRFYVDKLSIFLKKL